MLNCAPSNSAANLAAVTELIAAHVRDSSGNRMHRVDGEPIFDAPLVGVAAGDDPLFAQYRQIIGPFHLLPAQVAEHGWGAPGKPIDPRSLTVLCWVLPVNARTRASNYGRRDPSARWAYTRYDGEMFNDELREFVAAPCVRPATTPWPPPTRACSAPSGRARPGRRSPPGPSATRSMPPGWGPLASTTASSPLAASPCAAAASSPICRCCPRHGPTPATPPTASFSPREPAAPASPAAPWAPSRRKAMTRRCARPTWTPFPGLRQRMQTAIYGCCLCQTDVPCEHRIPVSG